MAKKSINNKGSNHKANIKNANKGRKGQNIIWSKAQGNRGKQIQQAEISSPTNKPKK